MQAWMKAALWVTVVGLTGCGDDGTTTRGGETDGGAATADMTTPRGSIAHQVALLKAGDVDAFKACFTSRFQGRITKEAMAKGAAEVGSMSIDDLVASVEEGTHDGKQTAKVKMKNGRTLTTLVLTENRWLADTIWFR